MSRLYSALFALLVLVLSVAPASAQEQQYELSNFDVTVHVRPDGTYEIEESVTYDFQRGTFSRAFRSIMVEDAEAVREVRVTSPDTPVDSVRMGEEDDVRRVQWTFPPRSEPAQFDIRYVLQEAIYERGDRNVVQLDVMADEALVPTRDVDVRVTLPPAFELQRDQITLEPAEEGTVQREAGRFVAHVHRDLVEEEEDYTVEVSFPKQVAGEFLPTTAQMLVAFLLVVLGSGAGGLAMWAWRGPRPEVTARRPPDDLNLPTAAALLRNRGGQAFPAVLFDLVQRGHVTLRHDREEKILDSEEIVRLDVHPDRTDLSDFEERFVEKLGEYDTLGDFWSDTTSFRKEAVEARRDALIERGWMRSHATRSNLLMALALVALLGGFVAIITGEGPVRFFLLFGGMGLSVGSFIAAIRRHTWTDEGAQRAMALRSFLDHEKSEVDRLRETDPMRAAERLVDSLPWLTLHDEVSKSWIEDTKEALDDAEGMPDVPEGFKSLVADTEQAAAATAAFLPVVGVMGALESSGAGAAGAAGAAGGGAGAAGAA